MHTESRRQCLVELPSHCSRAKLWRYAQIHSRTERPVKLQPNEPTQPLGHHSPHRQLTPSLAAVAGALRSAQRCPVWGRQRQQFVFRHTTQLRPSARPTSQECPLAHPTPNITATARWTSTDAHTHILCQRQQSACSVHTVCPYRQTPTLCQPVLPVLPHKQCYRCTFIGANVYYMPSSLSRTGVQMQRQHIQPHHHELHPPCS